MLLLVRHLLSGYPGLLAPSLRTVSSQENLARYLNLGLIFF